jgi:hypothetical protein
VLMHQLACAGRPRLPRLAWPLVSPPSFRATLWHRYLSLCNVARRPKHRNLESAATVTAIILDREAAALRLDRFAGGYGPCLDTR